MTTSELRDALRLHLALLTPRQRAEVEAGTADAAARARHAAIGRDDVDAELQRCRALGVRIVTRADDGWPLLLREMPDPPRALWVRGDLPPPDAVAVAIVGARRASAYGLSIADRLGADLAGHGLVVVSGGALGVDAAAHRAALAAGGTTVAVLGCGLDVTYPPAHAGLYAEIARRGAVVSELPCGTPPLPRHFPIRNRLLAGWSAAVAIVEATFKSGSLITARLALDYDRDVLAVPGPVTSTLSEGPNDLLASSRAAVLRDARDVLAALGRDQAASGQRPGRRGEARDEDPVLAALPAGAAVAVDELVASTGMPVGEVLGRLVALEAAGRTTALSGGLWMRALGGG